MCLKISATKRRCIKLSREIKNTDLIGFTVPLNLYMSGLDSAYADQPM